MPVDLASFIFAVSVQAVLIIFYFARLEIKSKQNSKDIDLLWNSHREHSNELKALARIEGKIDMFLKLATKDHVGL